MESCRNVRDFSEDEQRKTLFGLMNNTKPVFGIGNPGYLRLIFPAARSPPGANCLLALPDCQIWQFPAGFSLDLAIQASEPGV